MTYVLPAFAVLVTLMAGFFLVKRLQPAVVLLFSGILLLAAAIVGGKGNFLPEGVESSGSVWLDIFGFVESIAGSQLTGVGLIIMAAGGFSTYINKIGATDALVRVAIKPIVKIHRPYLVMCLAFVLGHMLVILIPSAASLAVLLVVLLLPIMVAAGVSPAAAAAVIATTSAMPLGPANGTVVLAADTAGFSPAIYFVTEQLPVAIPVIIAIMIAHFFVQRHFDRKGGEVYAAPEAAQQADGRTAPKVYAVLVCVPLVLLIVFSPLLNESIELTTVAAFIMGWVVAVVVELIRNSDRGAAIGDAVEFFKGMGSMFASVVALIIAAQLFAEGLKACGLISLLISGAQNVGFGLVPMVILLTAIVGLITFLTGSGVAALSAFAPLAPDIAHGVGGSVNSVVSPMLYASGLFRAFSPVAGVVIVVSGAVGVSPLAIVRRTVIPMAVGTVVMLLANFIMT